MIDLTNKRLVKNLVDSCVKGDRRGQELFYKVFYGKMLAVCMRYSRNREEAKDILHDGFIKVFMKLKSYEHKGSLEGWVRRIVTNNAIDTLRKKRDYYLKEEQGFMIDDLADDTFTEKELQRIDQIKVETLTGLIQKLTPSYQMVFNLYAIENLTHREIAEKLNVSIGTSKSNYAKAKIRLKELMNEYKSEFELY